MDDGDFFAVERNRVRNEHKGKDTFGCEQYIVRFNSRIVEFFCTYIHASHPQLQASSLYHADKPLLVVHYKKWIEVK